MPSRSRAEPVGDRDAETRRDEASRRELAELLERRTSADAEYRTAIPQLKIYRVSQPTQPMHLVFQAAVYVVVQGRKRVELGGKTYVYDGSRYLAVSVDLPIVSSVVEASQKDPYLCLAFAVDPRELAALIVETGQHAPRDDHDGRALYVSTMSAPLLDGFLRLVRLLDTPEDIPVLAPLIIREIHYRLLQSEQFGRLAQLALGDGRLRRVSGALSWIKDHYAEPLQIEALAKRVNMSSSALHTNFKAVTALSPIQYQKQLRLQEARRRLASGASSAEVVAREVGYESASQFSREYARLFGQPPRRDARQVRSEVG